MAGNFITTHFPVIVIGAGAAGMLAAWQSGISGASVLLLEKNPKPGLKIKISGAGKCNVTHAGSIEDILNGFRQNEARFLKHSIFTFSNDALLSLLDSHGVPTLIREDGKIFPSSQHSEDVVAVLERLLRTAKASVSFSSAVIAVQRGNNIFKIKTSDGKNFSSDRLIIAAGGMSYKKTGTTGDGYEWAASLGHSIITPSPALAPMIIDPFPPREWQGVALRDCRILLRSGGKILPLERGDLLFTHFGISGPAVLESSRDAFRFLHSKEAPVIAVDCLPSMTDESIEYLLLTEMKLHPTRSLSTFLEKYLPQRIVPRFCLSASSDSSIKFHQLKKEERKQMRRTLKMWEIGTITEIPMDRGEVTAGGVALKEVNSRTMESRIIPGLYFCGEVLDIAGSIGGYNLQAAFSTGHCAGRAAAVALLQTDFTTTTV